ncbi:uncharacterized protein BO66DRAFT_251615 [Aspergillus aculeatinus CBS 121060]|uniref:Uncharacterized protein n=1 Tax=Aspergillus aculeatinus CBS 121060 TaxID=1448322 RepID=A0ACD1HHJ1_9EURO|nr:hypothetical protein BO66DRAFT_251615 [Aspergillus aculeatinus CBS 121060]RAH72981.1 hypothetical protein BO66DRAFT_251615 [Aspergillus aculeatinus CBS 121060]
MRKWIDMRQMDRRRSRSLEKSGLERPIDAKRRKRQQQQQQSQSQQKRGRATIERPNDRRTNGQWRTRDGRMKHASPEPAQHGRSQCSQCSSVTSGNTGKRETHGPGLKIR